MFFAKQAFLTPVFVPAPGSLGERPTPPPLLLLLVLVLVLLLGGGNGGGASLVVMVLLLVPSSHVHPVHEWFSSHLIFLLS